ncbi:MAG: AtpZ/AtpI family protein [Ignavibacteria bacterium]|nr:AtpZ/AtpI family protein [Ignavibacteria bacterium]
MENDPKKEKYKAVKEFLFKPIVKVNPVVIQYSGVGIQIAATIIVFLFIGIWLDGKFDTKFIFTLIFTFLGFIGVFYTIFALVKDLDKKNHEKNGK